MGILGPSNWDKDREMLRRKQGFEERMSSTSYQRAVQDMKLAGLNPMLAYMQGGASTPDGGGSVSGPSMVDQIGSVANSAVSAGRLRNESRMMKEQMKLVQVQQQKASGENLMNRGPLWLESQARAAESIERAKVSQATVASLRAQIPSLQSKAEFARDPVGWWLDRGSRGLEGVSRRIRVLPGFREFDDVSGGANTPRKWYDPRATKRDFQRLWK